MGDVGVKTKTNIVLRAQEIIELCLHGGFDGIVSDENKISSENARKIIKTKQNIAQNDKDSLLRGLVFCVAELNAGLASSAVGIIARTELILNKIEAERAEAERAEEKKNAEYGR